MDSWWLHRMPKRFDCVQCSISVQNCHSRLRTTAPMQTRKICKQVCPVGIKQISSAERSSHLLFTLSFTDSCAAFTFHCLYFQAHAAFTFTAYILPAGPMYLSIPHLTSQSRFATLYTSLRNDIMAPLRNGALAVADIDGDLILHVGRKTYSTAESKHVQETQPTPTFYGFGYPAN
jgi:hypothetical protein